MIGLRHLGRAFGWKYIVGELFLIVAGILIALAVNDWGQDRRERAAELQLLREMRAALSEDLADNRTDLQEFEQAHTRISRLRDHLRQELPYTASLDTLFGALVLTRTLRLDRGPYEVLQSRGFELISDDSLRTRVAHLYGTTYAFIATRYDRRNEFVREYSGPYFFRNFQEVTRRGRRATPLSYVDLATDPYLSSLITWSVEELGDVVVVYREALQEGATLLAAIDRQIESLE